MNEGLQTVSRIPWMEQLDIFGTTAVVAVLSGLTTLAVCAISHRAVLRWSAALAGPFILAAALYYLPTVRAWRFFDIDGSPVENGSWAGLFIAIWGVAGAWVSLLVVFLWTMTTRRRGSSAA